jgi:hypothetical protein
MDSSQRGGTGQDGSMDLDAVADELYGLSPDDFTPTRTEREKGARAAGDRGLAAAIHGLRKPNAVAWLVNQLVRQHLDGIQTLRTLGSELREATANLSGDRLRELSRQQHQVVRGLIQQAERLAISAGRSVSGDTARGLEETLYAALGDQVAADALAAGRLTEGLRATGFAGLDTAGGHHGPSTTKQPSGAESPAESRSRSRTRTKEPRGVVQRERAKRKVVEAESVAGAAAKAREEANRRLQQAEQLVTDAGDRVEQLRSDLHTAVEAQSRAEKERRQAQSDLDRTDRRAQDAQQRVANLAADHLSLKD